MHILAIAGKAFMLGLFAYILARTIYRTEQVTLKPILPAVFFLSIILLGSIFIAPIFTVAGWFCTLHFYSRWYNKSPDIAGP